MEMKFHVVARSDDRSEERLTEGEGSAIDIEERGKLMKKIHKVFKRKSLANVQGVVTPIRPVDSSATKIKMKSRC